MKLIITLIAIFCFSTISYSQISFGNRNVLGTVSNGVSDDIEVGDFDNDGDNDVFVLFSSKLVLYNNIDGFGNFSTESIIDDNYNYARSITLGDINGDGFLDVSVTLYNEAKIVWYENNSGVGTFSNEKIISNIVEEATDIQLADFDNDGDLDIISIISPSDSTNPNANAWFENLDGLGNFGAPIYLADIDAERVIVSDLDQDNDIDILVPDSGEDTIFWFENLNSSGVFNNPISIFPTIASPINIECKDYDNDSDIDILVCSVDGGFIRLLKNDGSLNFSETLDVVIEPTFFTSTTSADFDNDGDLDIVSTSFINNKVAFYENIDGQGNFGPQIIIDDSGINPVRATSSDLDNDGKIDILVSYHGTREAVWYRNQSILSVEDNIVNRPSVYPNPVSSRLMIDLNENLKFVEVYSVSGKFIGSYNQASIDVSNLSSGLYLLKIYNNKGAVYNESFVKK